MKRRQRETARRIICGAMLVLYISITSTVNLFHTEVYNCCDDPQKGADLQLTSMTEQGGGFNSHAGAACPVCAFLKTFHSQVYHDCMLVNAASPPIQDFMTAEAAFSYRHPLPDLQTRAPPV